MRIAAAVAGIVGALCGIFFAQLIVSVSMLLAIVTSAAQGGELELGGEFYVGLLALMLYAFGVAGGVVVPLRPIVGVVLLLLSPVGGLVATIALSGAPSQQSGGAFVADALPYLGPVLLFAAAGLTTFDLRRATQPTSPASAAVSAPVTASRAELVSAVPVRLLAEPVATASSTTELAPGTPLESLEQDGAFVRVRGQGFEGFVPAWSVKRV